MNIEDLIYNLRVKLLLVGFCGFLFLIPIGLAFEFCQGTCTVALPLFYITWSLIFTMLIGLPTGLILKEVIEPRLFNNIITERSRSD